MTGKLYLIPAPISAEDIAWVLPLAVQQRITEISHFIVEHPKTTRQFLKQLDCKYPLQELKMQTLNEHTLSENLQFNK